MKRALVIAGTAVLALVATVGVVLSLAYSVIATDVGRSVLVPRVVRLVDDAIEGSIELRNFRLHRDGSLELFGVRVLDADGDVVLAVERVRAYVDLARIRSRTIGVRGEIDAPTVVLKRESDGSLSIARAFRPTHPSPKKDTGPTTWTIRLTRLTVRGGAVRYVDADGVVKLDAGAIQIDGRATYGPRGALVDAALRAAMTAPERAAVAVDVRGGIRDDQLRIRTLRASAGDTALDAAAIFDTRTWRGKLALLALAVDAGQVHELVPAVPLASDIAGTLYAESDGARASAALELRPRVGATPAAQPGGAPAPDAGSAHLSAAARLPPEALAAGIDLSVKHLDLARVLRGLPSTSLDLSATAHGSGTDVATLRATAAATLGPSRVAGGRVGPVELRATADRGLVDVSRLDAAAPGLALRGRGRWRRGGAISGTLTIDASDLAEARRNAELLASRRLPSLSGALHVDGDVAGTEDAPAASLRVTSSGLRVASVSVAGVSLAGRTSGALRSPRVTLEGTLAALRAGGLDARALRVSAHVAGKAGDVDLTGEVPGIGPDALALHAAGSLADDRRSVGLTALVMAWPGDRFELQRPARITFDPPSVDQLSLASGPQRIEVEGGLRGPAARRTLAARLRVTALDLALLPRAVVPPALALAGRLDADVTASGPTQAPEIGGRVALADGAVAGFSGVSAAAQLTYDGKRRRARASLQAHRSVAGDPSARGELSIQADLPVLLARAGAASAIRLDVVARGWSVPALLAAAKVQPPEAVAGTAGIELHASGTVGAPIVHASATLDEARWGDLGGLALALRADDPGADLSLSGSLDRYGARALEVEGKIPLRLAEALRDPGPTARRLRSAPMTVVARVPGLDLATLAGRAGVPEDLSGKLQVRADVAGTPLAPRGSVTIEARGVAYAGYRDLAARVAVSARQDATAVEAQLELAGDELARATASMALPVERLGAAAERERAALQARIDIPHADLRRTVSGARVPVAGTVAGHVEVAGSLAAPRLDADLAGHALEVAGHPLGEVALTARGAGDAVHAALHLGVTTGGTLDATLDMTTGLGIDALRSGALRRAPAKATLVANQLDLGFLPAVAPGVVRSASGKLGADVVATGPLTRMVPRGTVELVKGRMSVAEFGYWTDLTLRASLSEDIFRVDELSARRRDGRLSFTALVKGLAGAAPADLKAEFRTTGLTIQRAGQDLVTVDVAATMTGKVSSRALDAELSIPTATIKLPNRIPRKIQPLDEREDITVGKPKRAEGVAVPGVERVPYHARVHVLSPGKFFVKSDNPRINVELRADVTADYLNELTLQGDVETVRGQIEPISGRIFDLKSGRVHFPGGTYGLGALEIQAQYDNPTAKVYVAVTGTIEKPDIKLSSDPALPESQIALLIATGRSELKAGSGGTGTLTGAELGSAALGAVATQAFKDVVADKLPIDSVSLDSSQLRAGKYVTDKIYVGYTRRFNANPEQGENTNEVRVEYQISPRWTFESRYGDAQSGGASLIWSKDY